MPGTFSFKNNVITGNKGYPIELLGTLDPVMADNTFDASNASGLKRGIGVGGTITSDITWPKIAAGSDVLPYVLVSDLTVAETGTLTISGGRSSRAHPGVACP